VVHFKSDTTLTLPKKGQREQAQAGCTRGIGHRSARNRVQSEAQEESTGRFQAFPLAFWRPSSAGPAASWRLWYLSICRTLFMAADPISTMLTRGLPRTGAVPFLNGCVIALIVASTAGRRWRSAARSSAHR
jgi:hypothetical protein